ncbi:MAG: hypothetical protein ABR502_11810 [Chitinophagaceae bacterium]
MKLFYPKIFFSAFISCTNRNEQKVGGENQQAKKSSSAVIVQPKMVWLPVRYKPGSRGKGEVKSGSNNLGFRCVTQ